MADRLPWGELKRASGDVDEVIDLMEWLLHSARQRQLTAFQGFGYDHKLGHGRNCVFWADGYAEAFKKGLLHTIDFAYQELKLRPPEEDESLTESGLWLPGK